MQNPHPKPAEIRRDNIFKWTDELEDKLIASYNKNNGDYTKIAGEFENEYRQHKKDQNTNIDILAKDMKIWLSIKLTCLMSNGSTIKNNEGKVVRADVKRKFRPLSNEDKTYVIEERQKVPPTPYKEIVNVLNLRYNNSDGKFFHSRPVMNFYQGWFNSEKKEMEKEDGARVVHDIHKTEATKALLDLFNKPRDSSPN